MLSSKKILFIAPAFFNYSTLIKQKLEKLGASVTYLDIRPTSNFSKLAWMFYPNLYERIKSRYFNSIHNRIESTYDLIFIIRADLLPIDFLQRLKTKYSSGVFIQYIWDDVALFPKLTDSFIYFDRILSYNNSDSEKYNLKFRPFFFVEQHEISENLSSSFNEVFFIGSFHTDRLQVLEKVRSINKDINIFSHFYINIVTFIVKRIPIQKRHLFRFRKMEYFDMIRTIKNSVAILDIQNIFQQGLTTRIFEALGAKTKIITTNVNIKKYDFYNPKNILVIDRSEPVIEKSWLDISYEEYDKELLNNYSIEKWIYDVFDVENNTE